MLRSVARSVTQNFTFGLLGPKRPPGPSFFTLQDEPLHDEAYASLNFAIKLSQKYGDFSYIATADQYVVTGPEGFQHILKTNMQNYVKTNFFYNRIRFLFGYSLLTGDGEYWKQRRKIAQPAFQYAMIKNYVPNIVSGCQSFIDKYQKKLQQDAKTKPCNVLSLMNLLTLDIALMLFTGEQLPEATLNKLSAAIYYANYYVSHALFITPWKPTLGSLRFFRCMKTMDNILLACIRKQRQQRCLTPDIKTRRCLTPDIKMTPTTQTSSTQQCPAPTTQKCPAPSTQPGQASGHLLSALIEASDETGTRPLTDNEILAEFKTLLLTGHETTGCALTWLWYLLAENPEWRDALEQELNEVLQGRLPTLQDLAHLPILNAIFQETLRLYPPIWSFARRNLEEDVIYGYKIPKNSLLILNLYALHRNPRYWEKPNEFNPLRFLKENSATHTPYSFLPFSTGPRTCIASQLGTQEALLITAALAQYFRFEKCEKTKIRLEPCISLRPHNGLWLKITPQER